RASDGRVGAGLIGLTERVAAAGGTLVFGNAPGSGFQIIATMPASPEDTASDAAAPPAAADMTAAAEPIGAPEPITAAAPLAPAAPIAAAEPIGAAESITAAASSPVTTEANA